MMPKFSKRPVIIEAIQWTGDNLREVINFTGRHEKFSAWFEDWKTYERHVKENGDTFKIFTLEGTMIASPGDWIIRGVKGEHYPCKPDIFAATYAPVGGLNDGLPTPAPSPDDLAKVEALVEAGNVMANALRGDYIVPGSAAAWDAALAAIKGGDT